MINNEANRRLLDSLNVNYKKCLNPDCSNIFYVDSKNRLYCGEVICTNQVKERWFIRKESKKFYSNRNCSVKSCLEKGERHHEDYSQVEVLFLCPRHHAKLHRLKRRTGPLDNNMYKHFLLGHIG